MFFQPIENSFAKQRIIFQSDSSAAMIYPFLSLGRHKSAWTRHFQGITTHRSPIFWKRHYLILIASHFSPLLCSEEVNYSFFSILMFLGPQGLMSLSTHHTDDRDLWKVTNGLLIAKPTTSALKSFSSICAGSEGLLCSLPSLGLRFLRRW